MRIKDFTPVATRGFASHFGFGLAELSRQKKDRHDMRLMKQNIMVEYPQSYAQPTSIYLLVLSPLIF